MASRGTTVRHSCSRRSQSGRSDGSVKRAAGSRFMFCPTSELRHPAGCVRVQVDLPNSSGGNRVVCSDWLGSVLRPPGNRRSAPRVPFSPITSSGFRLQDLQTGAAAHTPRIHFAAPKSSRRPRSRRLRQSGSRRLGPISGRIYLGREARACAQSGSSRFGRFDGTGRALTATGRRLAPLPGMPNVEAQTPGWVREISSGLSEFISRQPGCL